MRASAPKRTASINFVNVGALAARAKELPGAENPRADEERRIEVGLADEALNLFLVDQCIRKSLAHKPEKLRLYKSAVRALMTSYSLLVPYKESNVIESPGMRRAAKSGSEQKRRDESEQRLLLTRRFVDVAGAFVNVVLTGSEEERDEDGGACTRCDGPLEERGDVLWCPECLRVQADAIKTDLQLGGESSSSARNAGDKLAHFKLIPQTFQGKEDYDVTEDQLRTIEEYARRQDIDLEDVSVATLDNILAHTGLAKELGNHMPLLHHTITGTPLPDIGHLEENIMARHAQVLGAFARLPPAERRLPLKSWYLFFQYLSMEEYEVDPRSLPITWHKDTLDWHNATMKKLARVLTSEGSRFVWNPVDV
jgi:hypothetical protein